ncbi:hypothetical protein SAMN04488550_4553 [Gordonia malaquae]|nr:hypothetical protein SAMN04488550_4553 [Gordonia malaquae]
MYGQPVGAYPYPPRRPGRGSLLTASTAQHPQKLFIVGIVLAVVSVVMVVFSCLSWTVSEVELKSADVTVSTSHSGLGGISKSVSGDDTDYFSRRDLRDAEREQEQDTDAPGAWTIVFGIVLGLAATALVARRFQPMAAFVAVLVGFASFITATVFFSDPVSAVFESWVDTSDAGAYFDRAYGIWFVFLGSIVALLAGVAALALVLLPEKFRPRPARLPRAASDPVRNAAAVPDCSAPCAAIPAGWASAVRPGACVRSRASQPTADAGLAADASAAAAEASSAAGRLRADAGRRSAAAGLRLRAGAVTVIVRDGCVDTRQTSHARSCRRSATSQVLMGN